MTQETKIRDPKVLALAYVEALAAQNYAALEDLLDPALRFRGPSLARSTAADFIGAVKRLGAIHLRSDVQHVFVDGQDVCVIYDFVTDTEAGALPMIEWITVAQGRIASINLYYDRLPWQAVTAEMMARGARTAAASA